MRIGLLGFGVVGRGVYDITAKRDDMQVAKVICLENVFLPDAEVVRDINKILEDDSIDTVIEAMGGLHPAYEFVRAAIEAGKNVVTSNKALVATFYDELLPLAEEKGVAFVDYNEKYEEKNIDEAFSAKEALPEMQNYVKENNKETLAQVFTDIRYTKKNNEYFGEKLLKTVEKKF